MRCIFTASPGSTANKAKRVNFFWDFNDTVSQMRKNDFYRRNFMKKCFILILLAGLFLPGPADSRERPIPVVTTIGQITDIVSIVGGDQIELKGLMGAGVDPHLYKSTESDVGKLAAAEIIFYNGLYLEARMEKIFEQMKRNKTVVAIGESIPVNERLNSENYSGYHDPHVWFDVSKWMKAVVVVAATLAEEDPGHADLYLNRADNYIARLEELDHYVLSRAREIPEEQRVLVTAHDAFRYFGQRYGFEVLGLQGLSTESEAGTRDVMRLADIIAERRIKAIFIESSIPERNIRAVQDAVRAKGWDVRIGGELFSDAIGDAGTEEGTYIGMVRHNIDTIVDALK